MRILIVHNKYKQYGGEDTVVKQEILAYQELGYVVELYAKDNKNLNPFDMFFAIFNPISFIKLKNKIKLFKPNVVHVHNIVFKLSPSIFWCIPKNIKVFMTIHNYRFICPSGTLFYDNEINTCSMNMKGLLKNIRKGVYRNSKTQTAILALVYRLNFWLGTFKRIDKFVFLTPFARDIHLNWKSKRFVNAYVKPNFLIEDNLDQVVKKKIDLIFIGRFTSEKGIMDVLPKLIEHKELKIHLVGDGPRLEEARKLTKNVEHISMHGSKTREDALKLLAQSKFLLFPSIWFEGMPMTIIEAYSRGTPVISRNIGAMRNMVSNSRTGFHYQTIEELAKRLKSLNALDYEKLSKNTRLEFYEKYSKSKGLENLSILVNSK